MKNIIWLIVCCYFMVGCGRKSDPVPEKPDGYPRTYPREFDGVEIQNFKPNINLTSDASYNSRYSKINSDSKK